MKIDLAELIEVTRETARGPQITPAFKRELQREIVRLLELGVTRRSTSWGKELYLAARSRNPTRRIAAVVVAGMLHAEVGPVADRLTLPECGDAAA